AGQHLPLTVRLGDAESPVARSYSLCGPPSTETYRIAVRRVPHGRVSHALHADFDVGDTLTAASPAGDFTLLDGTRPVALVSAGVGVTPMLAMLHALAAQGGPRRVGFFHVARDGSHHAFAAEVATLCAPAQRRVWYTRPAAGDRRGQHYDMRGRPHAAAIVAALGTRDADFYLCGPLAFMAELRDDLERLGVVPAHIRAESFGGAGTA
ncbi:MAG: FAD-binding oxidoreductase, partial [Gammaproteobacteria bacterium]